MIALEDEKGLDEKVLAVPDKDPRFNHMTSLRDVPEHVLREITNFFEVCTTIGWLTCNGRTAS